MTTLAYAFSATQLTSAMRKACGKKEQGMPVPSQRNGDVRFFHAFRKLCAITDASVIVRALAEQRATLSRPRLTLSKRGSAHGWRPIDVVASVCSSSSRGRFGQAVA